MGHSHTFCNWNSRTRQFECQCGASLSEEALQAYSPSIGGDWRVEKARALIAPMVEAAKDYRREHFGKQDCFVNATAPAAILELAKVLGVE